MRLHRHWTFYTWRRAAILARYARMRDAGRLRGPKREPWPDLQHDLGHQVPRP